MFPRPIAHCTLFNLDCPNNWPLTTEQYETQGNALLEWPPNNSLQVRNSQCPRQLLLNQLYNDFIVFVHQEKATQLKTNCVEQVSSFWRPSAFSQKINTSRPLNSQNNLVFWVTQFLLTGLVTISTLNFRFPQIYSLRTSWYNCFKKSKHFSLFCVHFINHLDLFSWFSTLHWYCWRILILVTSRTYRVKLTTLHL